MKQTARSSKTSPTFLGRDILLVAYFLLSVIYCASIMSFISLTGDHVIPFVQFVVLSFFCLLYSYAFLKSTMSMIITSSISIVFLVLYILSNRRPELFAWTQMLNLSSFGRTYYGLFSFLPLTLIWALYITIFSKKMFHFLALVLPGLLVFIVQLSSGEVTQVSFYACLGSILLFFLLRPHIERTENSFVFGSQASSRSHKILLSSVSLCVVAVMISSFLSTPLSQTPAHSVMGLFGFLPSSSRTRDYSHWSHPGKTSSRTQLGGNMILNDEEIFTLTAQTTTLSEQHLAATRKGVYENNQWSANARFFDYDESFDYNLLETRARQLALRSSFPNLELQTLQLATLASNETTLFHPLGTSALTMRPEFQLQMNDMGDKIIFPSFQKGEGYQISALALSEREISYMDQTFIKGSELDWNQHPMLKSETGFLNPTFDEYQRWIDANFRNIPDSVTPRTLELAQELTQHIPSPYEKVRALESYLQEIPYTLTPGPVPWGQDIVDYFLFDHRTGYCTYYATALCIMARAIGLPSRYVEGYHVSGSSESSVTVTNASAHSWVEVYFPHMGWITFDPTGVDPNAVLERGEQPGEITPEETPIDTPEKQNPQQLPGFWLTNGALSLPLLILLTIALLLLCGILTLLLLQGLRQRAVKRLRYADDRTFSDGYYRWLIRLLPLTGIDPSLRPQPSETVTQFFERIHSYFPTLPLQEVGALLEQAFYSDQPLSVEQRKLLIATTHQMEQLARQHLGKVRYFLRTSLLLTDVPRQPKARQYVPS